MANVPTPSSCRRHKRRSFMASCSSSAMSSCSSDFWMTTAHDRPCERDQEFRLRSRRSIASIWRPIPVRSRRRATLVDRLKISSKAFNGCVGSGRAIQESDVLGPQLVAEKSDVFQSAYIGASHNVAALQYAIYRAKHGQEVVSFHGVCGYGANVKMQAPVVYIAFLHQTDESIMDRRTQSTTGSRACA